MATVQKHNTTNFVPLSTLWSTIRLTQSLSSFSHTWICMFKAMNELDGAGYYESAIFLGMPKTPPQLKSPMNV